MICVCEIGFGIDEDELIEEKESLVLLLLKMAGVEETARMAALFWTTLAREGMGSKATIAFWSHVFAPGGRGIEVAAIDDVEVGAPPQGLT